jgi:hypothetical protein
MVKQLKKDSLIFKFLKKKVESDEIKRLKEELLKASTTQTLPSQ